MNTALGHLTFCTNIFPGESWDTHFNQIKSEVPVIKKKLAPEQTFGIGLRLSNEASVALSQPERISEFKEWLTQNDCVVFTMNGFPYGNFHRTRVKDQVHTPDWTTPERLDYTSRLFKILEELISENGEGSISTSPLSYKYWFENSEDVNKTIDTSTKNIVELLSRLFQVYKNTGKLLHIDIEPEADGLLENSDEFIDWYLNNLLPEGIKVLTKRFSITDSEAELAIRQHVQLCYDVCHFAVGFENVAEVVKKLETANISIGKWQLSAALKIKLTEESIDNGDKLDELKQFDEPVYLHQVVAQKEDGQLLRFRDLPEALGDVKARTAKEWRSHFHVPLFIKDYGLLESTQQEIVSALKLQKEKRLSDYLEVETYTWEVLPEGLKLPLAESIVREMKWVMEMTGIFNLGKESSYL